MRIIQRDLYRELHAQALVNHRRVAELARPLDPERLVRRPSPTGWSVGEVLQHLCVADESYWTPVSTLVHRARADAAAPLREWRPSLAGKLIAKALESPRRAKAPRSLRPPPTPQPGVVEDFLTRDSRLTALMQQAESLDWRALRLTSPAFPLPIIRLNLGDVFRIHVVHVRRHIAQMERVVRAQAEHPA